LPTFGVHMQFASLKNDNSIIFIVLLMHKVYLCFDNYVENAYTYAADI